MQGYCDAVIGPDHLMTGNVEVQCEPKVVGSTCHADCPISKCVPRPGFQDGDKYRAMCSELTASSCGRHEVTTGFRHSHRCEWANGPKNVTEGGPTFVCANGGEWVLDKQGTCATGKGEIAAACKQLHNTQCIEHAQCPADHKPSCQARAKVAGKTCEIACRAIKTGIKTNLEQCASCLYRTFYSDPVELEPPRLAIDTCCGCLEGLASDLGMPAQDVVHVLHSVCIQHDPLNDDDDTDDDDTIIG